MELFDNLLMGLTTALQPNNLLFCLIGVVIGTAIGVLPGIGPIPAIALLLPFTFGLSPPSAMIMLAGIFYGAQYGGSTTAILVNVPGETSSVVTCLDGHEMAKQGKAGTALAIAAIASFFAGTVATVVIAVLSLPLAALALKFTAVEYFSLLVLGLIAAVVLAHGSVAKSLAMVLLGILTERIVLRPLVNQPQITLFMATIGLTFLIEGLAQLMWGANVRGLELGLQDEPIKWVTDTMGMSLSKFDLVAAGVAAILVTVLALFFSRTRIGRALRAVADDHQAALAVGIPLQQIWAIVWGVAGAVALVAGLLWGARNGVQFALTFVALKALPVLILGGFDSIPGAIVGGLIIGASEKLAEVYLGPFVGGGIEGWFPYVLALVFLLIRPEGLFGEKIIRRI